MFWLRNEKIIFSYTLLSGGLIECNRQRLELLSGTADFRFIVFLKNKKSSDIVTSSLSRVFFKPLMCQLQVQQTTIWDIFPNLKNNKVRYNLRIICQ